MDHSLFEDQDQGSLCQEKGRKRAHNAPKTDDNGVRIKMLNIQCFINLMNTIRPDWMQNDEPLRKETERKIRRVMEFSCVDPHAQLSITQVSRSLGYAQMNTDDFMKAEKLAAERYSDISRLSTRKEIVDGKEQDVNIYTEGHRGLLTAVLRDLCLVLSSQESSYSSLPDE